MFVKYFIPEDGDEQAHPNVFRLDSTQPSFSEIKSAFPVPGSYHFRFLKNIGSHIVWLDVVDDGSALPTFQGSLFIKASRIANSSSASTASTRHEFAPSLPSFQQPVEAPSPRASEAATVSPPVKAPKPPLADKQKSEKLLKFDDDGASSPRHTDFAASAPAPSTGSSLLPESDLLGISSTPETASHKSAASTDFFGLEALQPMSAPVNSVMGGSQRSHSPMNPMTSSMSANPMGGGGNMSGKAPMGGPAMGMGGQNVMGGGRGMQNQGQQAHGQGMQGGMGAPPRQMSGPGTPGYDPFNNIAGLNGIGQNQGGRGTGMNGRR